MSILTSSKNQNQDQELFAFTQGIELDKRMAKQEIKVQKAWARSLHRMGKLSKEELALLLATLEQALELMLQDQFEWHIEDEDIHMNLERFLVNRLGELGKKIHLGRSRNDLIATTLRLFAVDSSAEVKTEVLHLIATLCEKAKSLAEVIVPGMTHLQNGQPIRFGHILAGHGWAFFRDLERLAFAQKEALRVMPLGSAALAGTNLKLNLEPLAEELGFESAPLNSYDSVGDRDFFMVALHAFSLIGMHLSRMSEDMIIWSSTSYGLVKLPPRWSTGSSIMPNKRNPDVPELIRAKSSHLIGASIQGQILMKGLPTSYNSDLHELKRIYILALDETKKCLSILRKFLAEIEVDAQQAQKLLEKGHLLATEVANHLTENGMTFREAYSKTASLVEAADRQGVSIESLCEAPFNYLLAVESRSSSGGTSLQSVLNGIEKLTKLAVSYSDK